MIVTEVAERYARVDDTFSAHVTAVRADQWDDPTPCTEWTVRQLVGHVATTHRRVLSAGRWPIPNCPGGR